MTRPRSAGKRQPVPDEDWFEVNPKDWLPKKPGKKLRLLCDANFPQPVFDELRSAGIDVVRPDKLKVHGHDDADLRRGPAQ